MRWTPMCWITHSMPIVSTIGSSVNPIWRLLVRAMLLTPSYACDETPSWNCRQRGTGGPVFSVQPFLDLLAFFRRQVREERLPSPFLDQARSAIFLDQTPGAEFLEHPLVAELLSDAF